MVLQSFRGFTSHALFGMCARWAWSSSKTSLQKDEDKEAVGNFLRGIIPKTIDEMFGTKMWTVLITANPVWLLPEPPSGRRPVALHCRGGHVVLHALLEGPQDTVKGFRRCLAVRVAADYSIDSVRLLECWPRCLLKTSGWFLETTCLFFLAMSLIGDLDIRQ